MGWLLSEQNYVNEPLRRWRRRTDAPLLVLAIGSCPLLFLELQRTQLTNGDRVFLDVVNIVVFAAFATDYIVELAVCGNRRSYIRHEIVLAIIVLTSAVAMVPRLSSFGTLRLLRGGAALRAVVAIARAVAIGGIAARDGRRLIRRRAFRFAVSVAGFTWITSAVAFTIAEDVGANGRIESFADALWWSAATITTVGYGDITPVTPAGRIAGLVAMVVGISMFAVVTARVAALLVVDEHEHATSTPIDE